MAGQTVILVGPSQRDYAKTLIDQAAPMAVVSVKAHTRTLEQNAKMWAMLADISWQQPQGRKMVPEVWKALFMHQLGFEQRFEAALDGNGFVPLGFKTSQLNIGQMSDLIELMYRYGAEQNIIWGDKWA
jgi:hypothetical protein